ncbi:MAG: hypothetical protein JNN32_04245 [Flavobacteriales bacterium]|nr:hypothetical protein [Flavobacteriales bacterium]
MVYWLQVPLSLLSVCATAQEAETALQRRLREHHDELTLVARYQQGRYGFAELGIGRNQYGKDHHPFDIGYYAGAELRVDRPELWGLKVGAYADGGFAMGVQYIHYFDGPRSYPVLRPEMGIGVFKAKMTYAYNVALGERMPGTNTHMLSFSYAFRVARLSERRPY